jgi:hypothetical protein
LPSNVCFFTLSPDTSFTSIVDEEEFAEEEKGEGRKLLAFEDDMAFEVAVAVLMGGV